MACNEAQLLQLSVGDDGRDVDGDRLQVSVLVVDPQTLFRTGMVRLLSEDERLVVTEAVEGGRDLPDLCASRSIDVVLTDMEVCEWNAVSLCGAIAEASPRTRVLILASSADWRVIPALASGAAGFLLKDAQPEAVRSAVLSVYLGGHVLCPEASRWFVQDRPDYRLTRREGEVLRLVAEGAGNREIAQVLRLGDKTVRNYVSRLYRKLAINNRADITSLALRTETLAEPGDHPRRLLAHLCMSKNTHGWEQRP